MAHILIHSLEDSLVLLPFLFGTYLVIEILETAAGEHAKKLITGAGKGSVAVGAALGVVPQCGFSAVAAGFYSKGIIGAGALLAVFMSTSDEMLPVFVAAKAPAATILSILAAKFIMAVISGTLAGPVLDRVCRRRPAKSFHVEDSDDCHEGHNHGENGCGCGHRHRGIIADAAAHTVKVFAFIFAVTLALNIVIHTVGQDALGSVLGDIPVLGEIVAGLIGLIPNCAASVIISQLYLDGVIGAGAMMSGLLVSSGAGVLVLFEENRSPGSNALILAVLYGLGVAWGLLVEISGVVF